MSHDDDALGILAKGLLRWRKRKWLLCFMQGGFFNLLGFILLITLKGPLLANLLYLFLFIYCDPNQILLFRKRFHAYNLTISF